MKRGKHICNTLKEIRKQIAKENNIEYNPRECTHKGDCLGTCPACESERMYLEKELSLRKSNGEEININGIYKDNITMLSDTDDLELGKKSMMKGAVADERYFIKDIEQDKIISERDSETENENHVLLGKVTPYYFLRRKIFKG